MVTRGRGVFLGDQPCRLPRGRNLSVFKIFVTTIRPYDMTNSNQIFIAIKLDQRKLFTGTTTPLAVDKKICHEC